MKALKMGKVLGTIRRKNTSGPTDVASPTEPTEGPEAAAARGVKAFCEAGGAQNQSGDEVLYLPPIVDAAESSPQAAAECARLVRKYLKRDYWSKPSYQYNAIMILRILSDNPGATFTRNIDQKFTDTVKELLRAGRDPSVQQILMETLDSFEHTKAYDEGLTLIIEMWKKEKDKAQRQQGGRAFGQLVPRTLNAPPLVGRSQGYFSRNHSSRQLPDPVELASRLEEANTSANLLQQVVTNTPPGEVLSNELIREFANRCTSASRSMQLYMTAENPSPDNETMETLIDTNERLQAALSLHQRAMLNARKQLENLEPSQTPDGAVPALSLPADHVSSGSSRRPTPNPPVEDVNDFEPPPFPPRKPNGKGKGREYDSAVAGPSRGHTPAPDEDPFQDPKPDEFEQGGGASGAKAGAQAKRAEEEPRLAAEPFHPGFQSTPSYVQRQESALGKETMHGAFGNAPAAGDSTRRNGDDDDEDIYDAPPKNKGPMYRY